MQTFFRTSLVSAESARRPKSGTGGRWEGPVGRVLGTSSSDLTMAVYWRVKAHTRNTDLATLGSGGNKTQILKQVQARPGHLFHLLDSQDYDLLSFTSTTICFTGFLLTITLLLIILT